MIIIQEVNFARMPNLGIVTNPKIFQAAFLDQRPNKDLDEEYGSLIRVLLYYVWRGAFTSRAAVIDRQVQDSLGLLCLSTYKAFLPII